MTTEELETDRPKQKLSKWKRLFLLTAFVVGCHTATSYFLELLYKRLHFNQPFFLFWAICIVFITGYSLGATVWKDIRPPLQIVRSLSSQGEDARPLIATCLLFAFSNTISQAALGYVSLPLHIVFKSSKLVGVMFAGYFVTRRAYSLLDYFAASCLVAGMVSFSAADIQGSWQLDQLSASDTKALTGIFLLFIALFGDSFLGNYQEHVQKTKGYNGMELMFLQSIFGASFIFFFIALSGELQAGLQQCWSDSTVAAAVIMEAITHSCGIVALLTVAADFSAVAAVLTGFARKIASLAVSYVLFPKPLVAHHVFGLLLVFGGTAIHSFAKAAAPR